MRSGLWLTRMPWFFLAVAGVFIYTTALNMVERPDGIKIASWFVIAIVVSSFSSRIQRSTELRFRAFEFADLESKFLWDSLKHLEFPVLVPHRPGRRGLEAKEAHIRRRHRLAAEVPIVFVEAELGDPSDFQQSPLLEVKNEGERFIISVTRCASTAHAIAVIALECSRAGSTAGNPLRLVRRQSAGRGHRLLPVRRRQRSLARARAALQSRAESEPAPRTCSSDELNGRSDRSLRPPCRTPAWCHLFTRIRPSLWTFPLPRSPACDALAPCSHWSQLLQPAGRISL